jgi:hypothetical protein
MDARPRAALSQVAAAVRAASCWGVKLGMNGQTAVSPLGDFGVAVPKQCYLLSQRGQDAVSFGFRTSFILAPKDGHSKLVRVFTFSTISGFVRAWLKVWRGAGGSMLNFPIFSPRALKPWLVSFRVR